MARNSWSWRPLSLRLFCFFWLDWLAWHFSLRRSKSEPDPQNSDSFLRPISRNHSALASRLFLLFAHQRWAMLGVIAHPLEVPIQNGLRDFGCEKSFVRTQRIHCGDQISHGVGLEHVSPGP